MSHVLVMAKAPVPGRVKTRLVPPLTFDEAARVARASLSDTLDAVLRCKAHRRVLALEGERGPWLPEGFEVIVQRGASFDERLANAWDDCGGGGLQIGMDTPQVTPRMLDDALTQLAARSHDAVLGPAEDGGWWAIGLPAPDPRVFRGIEMSRGDTGARQHERLRELGFRTALLPVLRDVDTVDDLGPVSVAAPGSRFAHACAAFQVASPALLRSGTAE
jgi:rSAM/selenodomain-associated transferase 1